MKEATIEEIMLQFLRDLYEEKVTYLHTKAPKTSIDDAWESSMNELSKERTLSKELKQKALNTLRHEGCLQIITMTDGNFRCQITREGEAMIQVIENGFAAIQAERKEDRKFRITTYIAIASPFIAVASFLLGYYLRG
jgi:ethanolamine utilization microcompartment shell protein EutL